MRSSTTPIRVRLPLGIDRRGVADLHERLGILSDPVTATRALHFDPRRRTVVVATVFEGRREHVAGYAAMDRDASEPDLLVAESPEARAALRTALQRYARKAA